jgi:uncharacterized protein (DUF952 family)
MSELLHITDRASWLAAESDGRYTMSTRGKTLAEVGFIHCCSSQPQLRVVAEFLYGAPADADADLVVLIIDSDRLDSPVRLEEAVPGGEEFPHIYGPVPVGAVVEVFTVTRDPDGRMALPR